MYQILPIIFTDIHRVIYNSFEKIAKNHNNANEQQETIEVKFIQGACKSYYITLRTVLQKPQVSNDKKSEPELTSLGEFIFSTKEIAEPLLISVIYGIACPSEDANRQCYQIIKS